MNVDEFIEALKNCTGFRWECRRVEGVRAESAESNTFCPITAVCYARTGKRYMSWDFQKAAADIDLDADTALQVAKAADDSIGWMLHNKRYSDARLRTQLLETLGLEESE